MYEKILKEYRSNFLCWELAKKISWTEKYTDLLLAIPWIFYMMISNWVIKKNSAFLTFIYIAVLILLIIGTLILAKHRTDKSRKYIDAVGENQRQLELYQILKLYQWEKIDKIDGLIEIYTSIEKTKDPIEMVICKLEEFIAVYLIVSILVNYNNYGMIKSILWISGAVGVDYIVFPWLKKRFGREREIIRQLRFDLKKLKGRIILEGENAILNTKANLKSNNVEKRELCSKDKIKKEYKNLDKKLKKIRHSLDLNAFEKTKLMRNSAKEFYEKNIIDQNDLAIRLRKLKTKKEEKNALVIPIIITLSFNAASVFLEFSFAGDFYKGIIYRLLNLNGRFEKYSDSWNAFQQANALYLWQFGMVVFVMLMAVILIYVGIYVWLKFGSWLSYHKDCQVRYEINYLEKILEEKLKETSKDKESVINVDLEEV